MTIGRLMLLSRVAEHLYWAARYLERAEDDGPGHPASTPTCCVDLPTSVPLTWEPLLAVTGTPRPVRRPVRHAADERSIITFLLADRENPSSVLSSVVAARENLRTTREVVPARRGRRVNDLYLYVDEPPHRGRRPAQPRAASSSRSWRRASASPASCPAR